MTCPQTIEQWTDEEYEAIQKTFAEEMRLAHRFRHPNVLGLIGLVEHPQSPYPRIAVFPWMEFGSLKGVLDEHSGCKPLKDFALLKACREIAQGMEYLVSNGPTGLGYVHRKLSARAVLVDATFTMKISDFSGMTRRGVAGSKEHKVERCLVSDSPDIQPLGTRKLSSHEQYLPSYLSGHGRNQRIQGHS